MEYIDYKKIKIIRSTTPVKIGYNNQNNMHYKRPLHKLNFRQYK